MSFRFRRAAEFVEAYRSERATPSDIAERALDAARSIDQMSPPMRSFIALDATDVREQARASTERYRAGRPLGPLDGVLVAVKDEFAMRGYGTTCGTSYLGKTKVDYDALIIARLRAAGAILFGKTNMHELGFSPSGVNPNHGVARNPYDPEHDTGGSSSGSGAVVAAGITPIALGNDGGGSIRIPAALCGVAGLKATYGRVPTTGASVLCWSLGHSGPLAASVEDLVAAFRVITDEPVEVPAMFGRSRAPRIGICEAWWEPASVQVAAVVRGAIDRLVAAGAVVESVDLPHIDMALPVGMATFSVEGATSHAADLETNQPISPSVRLALDMARGLSAVSYLKAQRIRTLVANDFEQALSKVDVLISPTTCITAPELRQDSFSEGEVDEGKIQQLIHFTMPLNLTGLPAMQVPCGYDSSGLPIGMQIVARHGADLTTLSVALEVERQTAATRPHIWFDLL